MWLNWLFGLEIDENSARLFLKSAVARAFKRRKARCGLGRERIVESVRSIRILGQLNIMTSPLQPLDVTFANRNGIVVVEATVATSALRLTADITGCEREVR